jgi:hypothetical protein
MYNMADSVSTLAQELPSHPILHVHLLTHILYIHHQTTLTLTTYNYRPPSRTNLNSDLMHGP